MSKTQLPNVDHIPSFVQGVNINKRPEECPVCGARHEPQYPHHITNKFRRHIFRREGRVATYYDLLSHTKGVIRESAMTATLQGMEVR